MYVIGRVGQQFFTCFPAGYIAFISSHVTTNQSITFGVHPIATKQRVLLFKVTYVERINSGFFVKIVCQMNTDLIYLTKKNISTYADKFE